MKISYCSAAVLALVLTLVTPCLLGAEPAVEESRSRFLRTALALRNAGEVERADFATTSLVELAATYMAEADLARHEASLSERGTKLQSWARAVDRYVEQLVLLQEDIDLGFPVELRQLHGQVMGVVTGGRTVILSHPRADQQPAFEQRVLTEFCSRNDCRQLTLETEQSVPIPVTASNISAGWEFTGSGPVCSYRNIRIRFTSAAQLPRLRNLCQQLLQEAETLAAELAWQQRHGVEVDWQRLAINPTAHRPEHLVLLNWAGDSILVTLPLLYSTEGLLQQLVPWLRGRYDGKEATPLVLDAAELGWQ